MRYGDAVTGRVPLFFNPDVTFGVVLPAEPMERQTRTALRWPEKLV